MTTDSRIEMPPPPTLERLPGRAWSTLAVWCIAASLPLGYATAVILVTVSTIPGGPGRSILLLLVVVLVLLVVFTVQDRKALLALGYSRPPRWPWLLLSTPAYLLVRFLRTRSEGASRASVLPLVVYLANLIVVIAMIALATFISKNLAGNSAPPIASTPEPSLPSQMDQIEQIIVKEEAKREYYFLIECPDDESLIGAGTSFECEATNTTGRTRTFTVTFGATPADGFTWTDPSAD